MSRVIRKIKAIWCAIKDYHIERNLFGKTVANACFRKKLGMIPLDEYLETISFWMGNELVHVIDDFKEGKSEIPIAKKNMGDIIPVWVCWLQGREYMPEWCNTCVDQLGTQLEQNQKMFFLSFDNISEYVDLPDYIYDLLHCGKMTNVAFSDVLRHALLAAYGGIWIDSAIYITNRPFRDLKQYKFWTVNFADDNYVLQDASRGKWINSLLYSKVRGEISVFCYSALLYLWKKRERIIDYLQLDYIIWTAYTRLPEIKRLIDAVPISNCSIRVLNSHLNDIYDKTIFEEITRNQDIHLVNRHISYLKEYEGKPTIYGVLTNRNEIL